MGFESCLKRISNGDSFDPAELVPYLLSETLTERTEINYQLAKAFVSARQYAKAKVFVERAWVFSDFSEKVLELYKLICESLNDFDALREAYKRIGIRYAKAGQISLSLAAFNSWQYVYATHTHVDKYEYDMDILDAIETLAIPYILSSEAQEPSPTKERRLRLAYLVFGAAHENSVLVKILATFAKYHDAQNFEVAFFVPEPYLSRVQKSKLSKLFESSDTKLYVASWSGEDDRLVRFAKQIQQFRPDIFVTAAGLADFEHYFLALLRPAPRVLSLLQGPPQQFTAQGFDHAISWSRHPLIDSPVNTSFIRLGVPLPESAQIAAISRQDLGLADGTVVLMSAGRYAKFQHPEFWHHLIDILRVNPDTCYAVVGAEVSHVPFVLDFAHDLIKDRRILFLGWRKDCLNVLKQADILIDTYPSGGGHVLVDSMALGKPIVSFANDYLHAFDQTDWSVAEEFVDIPELILQRGDFAAFKNVVTKLITDKSFRKKMGEMCNQQVRLKMPSEKESVSSLESEYVRLQKIERVNAASLERHDKRGSAIRRGNWVGNLSRYVKFFVKRLIKLFR